MHSHREVNLKSESDMRVLIDHCMMLPCDSSSPSVLVGAHARVMLLAVKSLKRPRTSEQRDLMTYRLKKLEAMQHPNVVRYLGNNLASGSEDISLVMEAWGVSVSSLVFSKKVFAPDDVFELSSQMLRALICLHDAGIVHGDVKPANMLYASNVYKLCDIDEGGTGTAFYMSARKARRHPQPSIEDSFSDTYALGLCVLEVYTGRQPFCELDNQLVVFARVCAGALPETWKAAAREGYHHGCVCLVQSMLDSDSLIWSKGCRATPRELLSECLLLRDVGEL